MGIYIFGGMKANKLASNELYYFRTGSRASREIQFGLYIFVPFNFK
jgi:hypothetical protein